MARERRSEKRRIFEFHGLVDAFRGLTEGLEATPQESAPVFKEAVETWAKETTKKAVRNLDRPNWLLSKSMDYVVREYKQSGKTWSTAGAPKDGEGKRAPSFYVRFHESGWRPYGGKPSAPKRFLTRVKQETKPILEDTINQANAKILKTFKEMVEKKIGDFKDFPEEKGGKNDDESGPALAKRQEMKSINGAASRRRFQYAAKGSSDDR